MEYFLLLDPPGCHFSMMTVVRMGISANAHDGALVSVRELYTFGVFYRRSRFAEHRQAYQFGRNVTLLERPARMEIMTFTTANSCPGVGFTWCTIP